MRNTARLMEFDNIKFKLILGDYYVSINNNKFERPIT